MRIGIAGIVGVLATAAAFGAATPSAMAQTDVCPGQEIVYTGVSTVDRCRDVTSPCVEDVCVTGDVTRPCVKGVCVTGVWENVNGALQFANNTINTAFGVAGQVIGMVPDPVCTPPLFSGPICVDR